MTEVAHLWDVHKVLQTASVQSYLQSVTMLANQEVGVMTMTQCDDDKKVFQFDAAASQIGRVIKGKDIVFHPQGVVSSPIHVPKYHVTALWNKARIYDQDFVLNKDFSDNFEFTASWNVPAYAMKGNWRIFLKGLEADGKTTNFCVQGDFIL